MIITSDETLMLQDDSKQMCYPDSLIVCQAKCF